MAEVERQQKVQLVKLDPKFILVVGTIWSALKLIFKFLRQSFYIGKLIVLRLAGKNDILKQDSHTKNDTAINLRKPTKQDSFLSYGGLKWYSQYTPQALKISNFKKHPNGTATTFKLWKDQEAKEFEISIFGEIFEEQLENIERSIDMIIEEMKPSEIKIKEIHLLKALGKYLDKNGVPDGDIIGFSLDESGACLLHEEAALDENLCYEYILKIFKEEAIRQSALVKAHETLWNQPDSIKERLVHNREYHPSDNKKKYGALRGRAIIDIDSPIADGVYLGAPAREAIYVNKDSDLLNQIYKSMLIEIRKIKEALGLGFEERVLAIASAIAFKCFPHNTQSALQKLRQNHRISSDEEITLDFFIQSETGDSEHSALLLAYLLEKLNKEQSTFLTGVVSIDRNWIPGGGHAWVRYTIDEQNIYIVDPMKSYIGRLDNYSAKRWAYERKSDLNIARQARPL